MSLVANEDFRHILRALNTNVDGKQKIMFAFTSIKDKLQSKSNIVLPRLEASPHRKHLLVNVGTLLVTSTCCSLLSLMVLAEEKSIDKEEKDEGIIGAIKSLFDPNEKIKSGKLLPKAYLKSTREFVKTLYESLNEDPDDVAKFRRIADIVTSQVTDPF